MDPEITKKFESLEYSILNLENEIKSLKQIISPVSQQSQNGNSSLIKIQVPEKFVDDIIKMDERSRFPILWYFSTKQIMSVKEFLNICSETGFSLSPSWLTSAGGNFSNRLVKEDKMFRKAKKENGELLWELTDIARLKIKRQVNEFESKK